MTRASTELESNSGEAAMELRLSLSGTGLYDSFRVALSPGFTQMTIGKLIDTVFSEDTTAPSEITQALDGLDIKANPDLPDIYLALSEIFDTWRRGECALHFFDKSGREIQLSQAVDAHLNQDRASDGAHPGSPVLDIVVEQTFDALAKFEERGGDKVALLQWLRGITLVYFIDKHGFRLQQSSEDEAVQRLLPIASDLQSRGILSPSELTGLFEITEEGRRTLGDMITETESYIDRFDLFRDVTYDLDADAVEFEKGDGADYRVQVYDAEGLDVYRTVFLLRMYDGTLDGQSGNWLEDIHSDGFFNDALRPVLDRERVDDSVIDWIIESGFAHNAEQAEAIRERESQQAIIRRIQSQ